MLQRLAKEHGWKHDEMLNLNIRILFAYYGRIAIMDILEQEEYEKRDREAKRKEKQSQPRQWQSF